jgi:hypothetical protein
VRGVVVIVCLLGAARAGAARSAEAAFEDAVEDDPKCVRGECLPPRPPPLDEDDPKLARGLRKRRPTARFELSYRFLQIADPFGGALPMHLVEATGFPVSGIFRLGILLSAGGAPRYSAWMVDVGLSAGVQYPFRVTPFFDVRFTAGVIGADLFDHKVVSYQYRPSIEGGIEVFLAGGFHLTAAVGWSHPVYGGVDANAVQQMINAGQTPTFEVKDLSFDTVTARVGLGF